MKKCIYVLLFLVTVMFSKGFGQIITVTPALPTDQDAVEVVFDATQGNGGLNNYTGDIYAHTGVITNLSTQPSDWKYVKADWGVNIPDCKLTSLGNNKWKLTIGPSIRAYYGVPSSETIKQLAFVFRSATQVNGNWLEGKTATGGDIFYDVYEAGTTVKITNPDQDYIFAQLNVPFSVSVTSALADSTILYSNGQRIAATAGNTINETIIPTQYGRYLVKAVAKTASAMVADSFYYYVRPAVNTAELPSGIREGINYISADSLILCLYAPNKQYVFAIGDFNGWLPDERHYMNKTSDGKRFWCGVGDLVPGKEYIFQYLVDGSIRIGDPYATKVSDPWNDHYIDETTYPNLISYPVGKTSGVASVLQTNQPQYEWEVSNFTPTAVTDMVIYETLLRDFTSKHSFQSLIDTLGYLQRLGINAIELMPVSEFEGNLSWGYNPNYYFAVDKYYGPTDKFKELIDECHKRGIAVIMDIVLNHAMGTSPYCMLWWDAANSRPSADNPFYNPVAKHDFNVGNDMNHESQDTRKFVGRVLRYWLSEFKVDGFRFDLSKGFTQNNTLGNTGAWGNYDESRINILKAYNDSVKAVNPSAVLILEHFADNSEEKVLSDNGMLIWGNSNYNYGEAAMGFTSTSDFSWASYKSRGWGAPNLVSYMESHDEERQMTKCIMYGNSGTGYTIKDTTIALQRAALTSSFFFTIPGPKMIWQFGEQGYDYSINWPTGTSASRLDNKPPRWDYLSQTRRNNLYRHYASLILLKTTNPLFKTNDYTLDVGGVMKKITLRKDNKVGIVVGNFGIQAGTVTPGFTSTGTWYDYISGDSIQVTNLSQNILLLAGESRLYMNEKASNPFGVDESPVQGLVLGVTPNPVIDQCRIDLHHTGKASYEISFLGLDGIEIDRPVSGILDTHTELIWKPKIHGVVIIKAKVGNIVEVKKVVVL